MPDTTDLMAMQYMNELPLERRMAFQMAFLGTKKNRTTALLLGLFIGSFGVDRFYLGQTLLGVLKLCTLGVCGVWTLVDWFLIMPETDRLNMITLRLLQGACRPELPAQYAAQVGQLPR
jgi:hypothetical protein